MEDIIFNMLIAINRRYEQLSKLNGSQAKLAASLEINSPTLNRQMKSKMTLETVLRTCVAFPYLSTEWLLRGNGNINLNGSENTPIIQTANNVIASGNVNNVNSKEELIAELRKQIDDKNKEIDFLRTIISNNAHK